MAAPPREHDLEKGNDDLTPFGLTPGQSQMLTTPMQVRPSLNRDITLASSRMSHHLSGMIQPDNPVLAAFRHHLGIHNDVSLTGPPPEAASKREGSKSMLDTVSSWTGMSSFNNAVPSTFQRPASNVGIYRRVVNAELKYHREYKIFAFMINGALGLQIIFAAALTALGAANGSHNAVTAFGAFNTVIAGLLTFLKGSGLPNRLKYYENEWSKVREYIEQRERDFATDAYRGQLGWDELAEEITTIEHMYENVRKDIEANTPDSYVSMSNAMKALNTNSHSNPNNSNNPNSVPPRGLARTISGANSRADSIHRGVQQKGSDFSSRILSGISEIEERAGKSWDNLEKQATVQVREVAGDAHNRMRDVGKQAESRITSTSHSIEDGIRKTQSSADSMMRDTQNTIGSRLSDAQTMAESHLNNAQNTGTSYFNNAQNAAMSAFNNAQNAASSHVTSFQNAATSSFNNAQNAAESHANSFQNTAASTFNNAQNAAESHLNSAQNAADLHLNNAQNLAKSTVDGAQHSAEARYSEAGNSAVSKFNDAQQRLTETQHQTESKVKEAEKQIMSVAEKAAAKVLDFTKHRQHRSE